MVASSHVPSGLLWGLDGFQMLGLFRYQTPPPTPSDTAPTAADFACFARPSSSSVVGTAAAAPVGPAGRPRRRLEVTLAVGRAVPRGHIWLYLPSTPSPSAQSGAAAQGEGGFCGAAGECYASSAAKGGAAGADAEETVDAEETTAEGAMACAASPAASGGAFAAESGVAPVPDASAAAAASAGPRCSHVWRVGVAFGPGPGTSVVEW